MSETSRQRFVRLANKRVNRALDTIRLIGNLANTAYYEYTDEDVRRVVKALEEEVRATRQRFDSSPNAKGPRFEIK